MQERDRDHEEVLRLRERMHSVEGRTAAHGWMLDELHDWRTRAVAQLDEHERRLRDIVKADEIAEAVAAKVSGTVRLSVVQKVVGTLAAAIAIAGGAKVLVG